MTTPTTETQPLLQASALACRRSGRMLFRDLAAALSPGEVLLVQGPNGSGKTTLLRILCGLRRPDAGEVRWAGRPLGPAARRELAYLGHRDGIKRELSVAENLAMSCALAGGEPGTVAGALEAVGLADCAKLPAHGLSAGQARRLALARLLLTRRRLWVLDEPLTALDSAGVDLATALLHAHTEGGGLAVLTSHQPLALPGARLHRLELTA